MADSSPPTGEFFHHDQQFNYTNPDGTHVEIKIIGVGSLQGTAVDSNGELHLLFSKTNAFTRIVSNVHGGTGQANLASIYSGDLYNNNAAGQSQRHRRHPDPDDQPAATSIWSPAASSM